MLVVNTKSFFTIINYYMSFAHASVDSSCKESTRSPVWRKLAKCSDAVGSVPRTDETLLFLVSSQTANGLSSHAIGFTDYAKR
jgi:hypothetical protein